VWSILQRQAVRLRPATCSAGSRFSMRTKRMSRCPDGVKRKSGRCRMVARRRPLVGR
jgi:hypothetical protein